ncbi:hypothetical protein SAMN05661012_05333 [Chitinophaga sancti]|uniref:Uncharacterized protein n=1 Tax=Chitinophaga sancti TaxID=1004 RepID=A0A1K1SGL9_9BACT|nr:hypothetical protein SAMN05661012_05333 [Chitinophaga sancti]
MFHLKNICGAFFLLLLLAANVAVKAQSREVCYNPNLVKDTTKRSIRKAFYNSGQSYSGRQIRHIHYSREK